MRSLPSRTEPVISPAPRLLARRTLHSTNFHLDGPRGSATGCTGYPWRKAAALLAGCLASERNGEGDADTSPKTGDTLANWQPRAVVSTEGLGDLAQESAASPIQGQRESSEQQQHEE